MSQKVKVAVVGASGYSGRELLRLLLLHPHAEIVAVTSRQLAGKPLVSEFPRFRGIPVAESLKFVAPDIANITQSGANVAFLALPHGVAHEFLARRVAGHPPRRSLRKNPQDARGQLGLVAARRD